MKIKSIDRWDDIFGDEQYMEIRLDTAQACCVKRTANGLRYIMECSDGNNVYSWVGGPDYPLRKLTEEETAYIIKVADEEFAKESTL